MVSIVYSVNLIWKIANAISLISFPDRNAQPQYSEEGSTGLEGFQAKLAAASKQVQHWLLGRWTIKTYYTREIPLHILFQKRPRVRWKMGYVIIIDRALCRALQLAPRE